MTQNYIGKQIHFVGIAGVGMSSVAVTATGLGALVSGSDRYADSGMLLPVLEVLKGAGVRVCPQDGSGLSEQTAAVVVSTAIEDDNLDLVRARELGVPVLHRSEMLAALIEGKRCVAVAGTCGKTTVTGMLGYLLESLGADPTVVNGGAVVNWRGEDSIGNARVGKSDLWVIEADESDRSLLNYHPECAIITNMSQDHFGLDETIALFQQFSEQVSGVIVRGSDDGVDIVECGARCTSFVCDGEAYEIHVPGRHNVENAVCAIRLCRELGYEVGAIRDGLVEFQGIERRLECKGVAGGVTVFDDYGHNPAKIEAAWVTLAPYYPRLHVLWRPHGFGPLASMKDSLIEMFARVCRESDCLWVLPVYYVGGTTTPTLDTDGFVQALQEAGVPARVAPSYDAVETAFVREVQEGDAVVCMGARDPELPVFAGRLVDRIGAV